MNLRKIGAGMGRVVRSKDWREEKEKRNDVIIIKDLFIKTYYSDVQNII